MNETLKENNKKMILLTVLAAVGAVAFSFMGAPLLRVLSSTSKRLIFWGTGFLLILGLFFFNQFLAAISAGSVWVMMGAYTELEKKGIQWRLTILCSLFLGFVFGLASSIAFAKGSLTSSFATSSLEELTTPLYSVLSKIFPDKNISAEMIYPYLPSVIFVSLMITLAAGLVFETQIFRIFQLRREKIAAGLRWLEFKLPDSFIWLSMFGFLFAFVDFGLANVRMIAINISIITTTAFFIQGIVVFEYVSRFLRFGLFTKTLTYLLILLWLTPAIAIVGLIDYWADFRTKISTLKNKDKARNL